MSAPVQELVYNVTGQKLVWDALEGRASSVTDVQMWEIGDGDDDTEQTAPGSNAVETNPNTTINSASGVGQSDRTAIYVTANTGITVGHTYLITNPTGETEWVTIKAVDTSVVYATAPLKNAYPSSASSTFVSTRLTSTINATWIADEDNISDALALTPGYRVRWTYVVSSTTYVHDGYFDVVRYPWQHAVTQADMRSYVPDWDDRLPTWHHEDGGKRLIDRAATTVKLDLKRAGVDAALIRQSEVRDELVMAAARVLIERPDQPSYGVATTAYNTLLDGLIRIVRRVPISADDSGAGHQTTARAIWSK